MDFTLKKFEMTNKRFETRITVTRHKSFGFPKKFFDDNHVGDYKYVILYYDESQKAVGFQLTNSVEEPHKFTIIRNNKGYGGSVIASSFFGTYNIDPLLYYGRYTWEKKEYPDIGTVFVIVLHERKQVDSTLGDQAGSGTPGGAKLD